MADHKEARTPLRVGIIVESQFAPEHICEFLAWALARTDIRVTHAFVHGESKRLSGALESDPGRRGGHISRGLWRLICALEQMRLSGSSGLLDLKGRVDCIINVKPVHSSAEPYFNYNKEDVSKIQECNLDVLICFLEEELRGHALSAARLGVLAVDCADNCFNRGGPVGFWEVYCREPTTGFVVKQLAAASDGDAIVFRGACPTQNYFLRNQARVRARASHYLRVLLPEVAALGRVPVEVGVPYFRPRLGLPALSVQVLYIARTALMFLRGVVRYRILKKQQRWAFAFARVDWRRLDMGAANFVENPQGRFWADPFVISRRGKDYCFVEDFDHAENRGCVSVLELGSNDARFLEKVVVEPFHMSFPYVFEHEGAVYMIPETSENRDIRLYESSNFPFDWKLKLVLMENISSVDTMLFKHGDYWWLFTNTSPVSGAHSDNCSELSIFYSENPFSQNWVAHPKNPIVVDPTRARNGGILVDRDAIYRVSQVYGFGQYGAASKIFKIVELTIANYVEVEIANIKPEFMKGILGTHHLHSNGRITVFDYVREEIV